MKHLAALAVLALAACGQSATDAPPASDVPATVQLAPGQPLGLACEAFVGATLESLAEHFGAANVVNQTLPGPEGESYDATVIFPDDPGRRLEVHWQDPAAHTQISEVSISGELSDWRAPNGLVLGQSIEEVERLNGRAFSLYGFGWDYGGNVADWLGGAFAPRDGCIIRAQFYSQTSDTTIMGDQPFSSDLPAMRAAQPRVNQIALGFRPPA